MRKQSFYCDCCEKQVKKDSDLVWIEISLGSSSGVMNKEVCHSCWGIYTNKIAEVAIAMFKNLPN